MDPREMLTRFQAGELSIEAAIDALGAPPVRDVGVAVVDAHRALRQGVPEVIFGHGKRPDQVVAVARALVEAGQRVLVTRAEPDVVAALREAALGPTIHSELGRTVRIEHAPRPLRTRAGTIAVVTAGTSDLPVAEECAETLAALGLPTARITDVGVAGIHRLLDRVDVLRSASVVIAIAGMEGALPSVVGGFVSAPVIAVPTSIGYGSALGGLTPMFAMLTSCASGLVVVNVDNGFGAAIAAHRIVSALGRVAPESP